MSGRLIRGGWRQIALLAAMLIFALRIASGLVFWQVTQHAAVAHAAAHVYNPETIVPAPRGSILDAQGVALVTSQQAYLIAVDPTQIASKAAAARQLAGALGLDAGVILQRLEHPASPAYTVLARQVPQSTVDAVRKLGLAGMIPPKPTWYAAYPDAGGPYGPIAGSLLGFVDASGRGQYGLEQRYDSYLTGQDGIATGIADSSNPSLPTGITPPRAAVDGDTLSLTIDSRVQTIVEQRLLASIKRYGATAGTAVVMDPHTGAIMALASLPSYDPNHYTQVTDPSLFRNLAVASYQPGSTFKILSVAAGLDHGDFTPQTTVNDPGFYDKYGMEVHNWEAGKGWGIETPQIMLEHSANVGMVQFVDMIKPPMVFYDYLKGRFGLGQYTGLGLPGEDPGIVNTPLNDPRWSGEDLFTNSYGQSINVTPIQLTAAVGALANGGVRMRPYLVRQIVTADGRPVLTAHPHAIARAVSPATAATMTNILERSAYGEDGSNGEALCALTQDYPVAAKTGTATIDAPAAHGLNLDKGTTASLIGYAPADNPKFVMLVTLTDPHLPADGNHIWGSTTAAPTWHDIAMKLYRVLGIPSRPGSTPSDVSKKQYPGVPNGCEFMKQ